MEGGSFTVRSIVGSQFQISVPRFRNVVPRSRVGSVIRIKKNSSPSDHEIIVMSRVYVGLTIEIIVSLRELRPRVFWSARRTISVAFGCATRREEGGRRREERASKQGARIANVREVVMRFKVGMLAWLLPRRRYE